jgi:hypothetical protein
MNTLNTVKKCLQRILWIAFFVLIAKCSAFAQAGNGGINGMVTDTSGAVIPGTVVHVQNNSTGVVLSKATNKVGVYSFSSLPPASYQVTFTQKGFDTSVHNDVVVTVDQVTTVNASLQIGTVTAVVIVTGASALIESSNSTVGQLVDEATIDRVPLLTRDVYQLVQLSAGVGPTNGVPNASDTSAVFNARPGADVGGYTVNGATPGSLQFLVDGSPIGIAENNLGASIPAMQIPLDDVVEYRVETQNAPATYQSGGAGAISLVTKSGSNQFHGDGFVYIRPDILSGNDYFLKQSQLSSGQPSVARFCTINCSSSGTTRPRSRTCCRPATTQFPLPPSAWATLLLTVTRFITHWLQTLLPEREYRFPALTKARDASPPPLTAFLKLI